MLLFDFPDFHRGVVYSELTKTVKKINIQNKQCGIYGNF